MKDCWMIPKQAPCLVLGGRFGDILQMAPCFYAIYKRTGFSPVVITSSEYTNIYEGMSYVTPYPMNANWWMMVPQAKKIANELFGGGSVVQFWQLPPEKGDEIGAHGAAFTTLQCHGNEHGVNMALDPDYGTSMARRCGFSRDEWIKLPLVFDRRNTVREQSLIRNVIGADKRKVLLYNFKGISSPFPFMPEVVNALTTKFSKDFKFVDLGKVQAIRIFDLLGLYDRAAGLISADTATAHLAVGSKIPTIWYTHEGWTGSVPRGNVAYHCGYESVLRTMEQTLATVETWK